MMHLEEVEVLHSRIAHIFTEAVDVYFTIPIQVEVAG